MAFVDAGQDVPADSKPDTAVLPSKVYATGEVIASDPVQVAGECIVEVDFDISAHTDPKVIIEVEAIASMDGGITWESMIHASLNGGVFKDPVSGQPITRARFQAFAAMNSYDEKGNLVGTTSKWKDPIIKIIQKVSGGSVKTDAACKAIASA